MTKRKRRDWPYTAGEYGWTVRAYDRSGVCYLSTSDGHGGCLRRSLRHRDRERARRQAHEEALKLRQGLSALAGPPTLSQVLELYLEEVTPTKVPSVQSEDRRQAKMFRRLWGNGFDLRTISRRVWDRFLRERKSGAVDGRGHTVQEGKRRVVSERTVERDLRFLRAVCRWATEYRDRDGRLLLEHDPTRGLPVPREMNPERPVATHDRVDAIREHYHKPLMVTRWHAERELRETYLPEVFEIIVGTGRRVRTVLALRYEDLDLEATPSCPDGAITWPEDTDKQGKRWRCPISASVRQALDSVTRKRPRVGDGPLFPSPKNLDKPVRYELACKWLREAEKAAELKPLKRGRWHPYRRLWATSRKDLPDVDVAQAGGWSSLEALKLAYQRPDEETMLRVVQHDTELREVR
jgi:hypothetical protein